MFSKLKEKLKSWTKRVSKESVREGEETHKKKSLKKRTEKNLAKKKHAKQKKEIGTKKAEEKKYPAKTLFLKKIKIDEKNFENYAEELRLLLLENNVALEVADRIVESLKIKLVGQELLKKEVETEIRDALKEIIEEILIEPFDLIEKIREKANDSTNQPYVILFCGINGTGKTTTIAKIAELLKKQGISCILAAADTFRAASIEQIKEHGEKIGVKVVAHEYGSDPASVGFDAINYAKKRGIKCVLIDTAGRMHTSKNLLKEIEKISRVCKPDLKIFVGESIAGNDIIEQIKSFEWAIGIDAIILTKSDIDEKGGSALSVGYITKKPILFLGTGQTYGDLEPFDKEKFIKKLEL